MSRRSVSELPATAVRVWQPEDAAAVRELADEFPSEVGSSVLLDLIVERAR